MQSIGLKNVRLKSQLSMTLLGYPLCMAGFALNVPTTPFQGGSGRRRWHQGWISPVVRWIQSGLMKRARGTMHDDQNLQILFIMHLCFAHTQHLPLRPRSLNPSQVSLGLATTPVRSICKVDAHNHCWKKFTKAGDRELSKNPAVNDQIPNQIQKPIKVCHLFSSHLFSTRDRSSQDRTTDFLKEKRKVKLLRFQEST